MKNNTFEGRGVIHFLPMERWEKYLLEGGLFERGDLIEDLRYMKG